MTTFHRARILLFVPLLGLAVLSGCGGSSSSSDTTATPESVAPVPGETTADVSNTSDTAAAAGQPGNSGDTKAFSDCLKEQGVELPEVFTPGAGGAGNPGSIPEGLDLAKLQPALAACQDKLPAGAGRPGSGASGAGGADFSAYTTCLKDNGVAIPEPFDPSKLDPTDPKFTAAATTCQPLLPAGLPGVGAGAPSTTMAA